MGSRCELRLVLLTGLFLVWLLAQGLQEGATVLLLQEDSPQFFTGDYSPYV